MRELEIKTAALLRLQTQLSKENFDKLVKKLNK